MLVVVLMASIISLALVQTRSSYSGDWDEAAQGSASPFDPSLRHASTNSYGAASSAGSSGGSAGYGDGTANRFESFSDLGVAGGATAALRGGSGSATGAAISTAPLILLDLRCSKVVEISCVHLPA